MAVERRFPPGPMGRLLLFSVSSCLFLAVLYPWRGDYYPEGNWFRGPLSLFKVQASVDKLIGGLAAAVLTPLIFASVVRPGRIPEILSLLGISTWIGFGLWLASMAAV